MSDDPLVPGFNGSLYQAQGNDANCTLALCSIEYTIFKYRPSLGANAFFLAAYILFSFLAIYHMVRYKKYFYSTALLCGFLTEIAGYAGRIAMYKNTFNHAAFLDQISESFHRPSFTDMRCQVWFINVLICNKSPSRLAQFSQAHLYISHLH